jgi:hypothetical protein
MAGELTEVGRELYSFIFSGDVTSVRGLLNEHPEELAFGEPYMVHSWLHLASKLGRLEIVKTLVELGIDVNKTNPRPEDASPGYFVETALGSAVTAGHVSVARYLLSRHADPTIGRTLIAAINQEDRVVALELVRILVEHGADVNCLFRWYDDDRMPAFTPLTWAEANGKTEIAEYLRSKGAVPPDAGPPKPPLTHEQEIMAHFEAQFGSVPPLGRHEIVPTGLPIAIHVVPPTQNREHITLFTVGMSAQPMTVPAEGEKYTYAELLIHLPADWPLAVEAMRDPNHAWPFEWLRNVARYPHAHRTWLGGPVTIIANGEPPHPLSPNNKFVAMLLFAESEMHCQDGRLIQLYTLSPLYKEEYELERANGIGPLFQAFDRAGIERVVDLNRPNVAI